MDKVGDKANDNANDNANDKANDIKNNLLIYSSNNLSISILLAFKLQSSRQYLWYFVSFFISLSGWIPQVRSIFLWEIFIWFFNPLKLIIEGQYSHLSLVELHSLQIDFFLSNLVICFITLHLLEILFVIPNFVSIWLLVNGLRPWHAKGTRIALQIRISETASQIRIRIRIRIRISGTNSQIRIGIRIRIRISERGLAHGSPTASQIRIGIRIRIIISEASSQIRIRIRIRARARSKNRTRARARTFWSRTP